MAGIRHSHARGVAALAFGLALGGGSAALAAPAPGLTAVWLLDQHTYDHQEEFRPPLKPEVKAIADAKRAKRENGGAVLSDNGKKCLPVGMPSMVTNEFALEILETPGRVTMLSESSTLPRTIALDRKTHLTDQEPSWNGDAVGRWEGKTLVVETTGLNDRISHMPFGFGGVMSLTTKITERYSLADGGQTLVNQMTFDDPNVLIAPWTVTYKYHRAEPGAQLWEYVCEVDAPGWSERFQGDPDYKKPPGDQ